LVLIVFILHIKAWRAQVDQDWFRFVEILEELEDIETVLHERRVRKAFEPLFRSQRSAILIASMSAEVVSD
jgi:hypothetical protein